MNLPLEFTEKMKDLLGDNYDNFISSLDNPEQKAITVNFNKITHEDFEKLADFEYTPIEDISNGYYVNSFKFGKHILTHAGIIYSQEPSAMYPVELLNINENDLVLDMCASPGGKSIQILEKLNNTGLLVSNEIVYNRAKILYENLNRMGFRNFAITCENPQNLSKCEIKFDKILIDAPCGGEGMFRKDNFDFNSYKLINVDTNAKRQLAILESAKNLLRDGGKLVYSTCTYDIKENEEVVANFLQNNPNFRLVKVEGFENTLTRGIDVNGYNTNLTFRRYPHLHRGEGQFMAILEKDGNETHSEEKFYCLGYGEINRKDEQILSTAFKNVADITKLHIIRKDNDYFVCPNHVVNFGKINLLTMGVVMGTYNKNIFKINHTFYHTYGDLFYNQLELNDNQILKYLHGEEIEITDHQDAIVVIKYKGLYIGGGKITNNRLKNYYPKELRI